MRGHLYKRYFSITAFDLKVKSKSGRGVPSLKSPIRRSDKLKRATFPGGIEAGRRRLFIALKRREMHRGESFFFLRDDDEALNTL